MAYATLPTTIASSGTQAPSRALPHKVVLGSVFALIAVVCIAFAAWCWCSRRRKGQAAPPADLFNSIVSIEQSSSVHEMPAAPPMTPSMLMDEDETKNEDEGMTKI